MSFITDIILVNKEVFEKTIRSIKSNWQILLVGVVYAILSMIASIIVSRLFIGPLGLARGLILALIEAAIISSYIFVLYNVISYNRFRWRDVKNGFTFFIWKVYAILFMFYLGSILLSFVGNIIGGFLYIYLMMIISLLLFVVLNPLPEALYVKTYTPWDTVIYCWEFMKDNWLNWIVPNVIFFILLFIFSGQAPFYSINPFRGVTITYGFVVMARYLISSIILSFGMLYRGHLFTLLSTSSKRKRQFMRKV